LKSLEKEAGFCLFFCSVFLFGKKSLEKNNPADLFHAGIINFTRSFTIQQEALSHFLRKTIICCIAMSWHGVCSTYIQIGKLDSL